jgi:hypothetical protein
MTWPNVRRTLDDGYIVDAAEAIMATLMVNVLVAMTALLADRRLGDMDPVNHVYRVDDWEVGVNLTGESQPLRGFRRFLPNQAARFIPASCAVLVLKDRMVGALQLTSPYMVWSQSAPAPRVFAIDVARAFLIQAAEIEEPESTAGWPVH